MFALPVGACGNSARPSPAEDDSAARAAANLSLQPVLLADLGDEFDLRLEVVDVLLGVVEDVLEDLARDVVAHALAMGDGLLEQRVRAHLDAQIAMQRLDG